MPLPASRPESLTATSEARARRPPWRVARDHAETVLVAILVVVFVTTFGVQNSVIPSASMEDTLLIGDHVLVNRVLFAPADAASPSPWLAMRPVDRGDVVVFKHPDDPVTNYIKRVIGLPGDVIEVRNKAVWRNGQLLAEPHAVHRTGVTHPREAPDGARDNFGPMTVPPNEYFVMGDNRDYSRDSREFGTIPREVITGRAFLVFFSRSQRPGAFRGRAPSPRQVLESLRSFHRDVRWDRILTPVR